MTVTLPARRYFLYGYYGQNNFGDDLLLQATIERMYRERGKLSAVGPLE